MLFSSLLNCARETGTPAQDWLSLDEPGQNLLSTD